MSTIRHRHRFVVGCSLAAAALVLVLGCGDDSTPFGTGGSSSGGAAGVPCSTPADCDNPQNACQLSSCVAGKCGVSPKPVGTVLPTQPLGDCKEKQCDGNGATVDVVDDTDVKIDGKECTDDVCTGGVSSNPAKPAGTACGTDGHLFCSAGGACVECGEPADCAVDMECRHPTCRAGSCGFDDVSKGTPLAAQTVGDCQLLACDGAGGQETLDDVDDIVADTNDCTDDLCDGGAAQHPVSAADAHCAQDGGTTCDGAGHCVECNHDSDCAGGACDATAHTCAPTCTDASAPGATCTSYCTCMTSTCATAFASFDECILACALFDEEQVCCRASECTAAESDPATHCTNAAGEAVCP